MGLDEDLGRHAGHQSNIVQAGELVCRQGNAHRVIRLCRLIGILLLARDVGRHARNAARYHRGGPLVAGHDVHDRLRSRCDLIDVLGGNFGLDHQLVGARDDLHNGFAFADHAAYGVRRKLVNGARLRRAQIDPLELVLGARDPFLELRDLALGLAQVFKHFGQEIPVNLDNLQLRFGDFATRAGDVGDDLATLTLQPRLVALELRVPRN